MMSQHIVRNRYPPFAIISNVVLTLAGTSNILLMLLYHNPALVEPFTNMQTLQTRVLKNYWAGERCSTIVAAYIPLLSSLSLAISAKSLICLIFFTCLIKLSALFLVLLSFLLIYYLILMN